MMIDCFSHLIKRFLDDLPVGKVPFSSDLQEVVLKTAEDMNFTIIDKNVDSDLGIIKFYSLNDNKMQTVSRI